MAKLSNLDLASRSRPVTDKPKNFKKADDAKPADKGEAKKPTAKERRAKIYDHPRSKKNG